MKVAVGLFVKNEAEDIFFWLAWYQRLGVDCVFVGNDNSSDNTESLIKDVSHKFDVRFVHVENSKELHIHRQCKFYEEVIYKASDEFEWIGFFDADEYLSIEEGSGVKDYLSRFDESVSQISINWCNYGSSNNILNTHFPPPYSYVHHSSKECAINTHVKSFIRPQRWSGEWVNPHVFNMLYGREVDSSGKDILFGHTRGITKDSPQWDAAKIMHFQARSLEHFIKRVKIRKDVDFSMDMWREYDFTNEIDNSHKNRALQIIPLIRRYIEVTIDRVCGEIDDYIENILCVGNEENIIENNLSIFYLKSHEGRFLYCNGKETSARNESDIFGRIFVIVLSDNKTCLMANDLGEYLYIKNECRLTAIPKYNILFDSDSSKEAFLLHPHSEIFLSCTPVVHGGTLSVHTKIAKDWEKFSLEKIEDKKLCDYLLERLGIVWLKDVASGGIDANFVKKHLLFKSSTSFNAKCVALSLLKDVDAAIASWKLGGVSSLVI